MDDSTSVLNYLLMRSALFVKFWMFQKPYIDTIDHYISPMPGHKEGITSSTITSYNIGVKKKIDDKIKDKAIEIVKFLISDEFQKKIVMNGLMPSLIPRICEDEDVRDKIDCTLFNSIQMCVRKGNNLIHIDEYINTFREYIYEFIYGDKDPSYVLDKVEDISKIYYIVIDNVKSVGFIYFVMIWVFIAIMGFSLIFLFIENFAPFFKFLSDDFWIIQVLGSIITLAASFEQLNAVDINKCYLKFISISLGLTLSLIPISHKLIVSFPASTKFVIWVNRHKYCYLLFFILIDMLIFCSFYFEIYEIENVVVFDHKNFQRCKLTYISGYIVIIIEFLYKLFIFLLILLLSFIDWNIYSIYYDLRLVVAMIYVDIISLTIFCLINIIKINRYKANFYINEILILLISFSNYILLYGFRIMIAFLKKQNIKLDFINRVNDRFINSQSTVESESSISQKNNISTINKTTTNAENVTILKTNEMDNETISNNDHNSNDTSYKKTERSKIISRIMNYHYSTESSIYNPEDKRLYSGL
ncbi:hypothetical protein BCR32DRAFT_307857 [Anaeromyces robustus]|uniref:G-protein coupled receptors family 3 profile domain-containing protein n=1 Tax=Anaeromyces robustus TaxID=1754192 RepID=A0A1Y1XDC2_9FUNG|nr:hypothetical protein BCR32DRAFT_307857 [Anaeromyces robustus]|eukprot:ORX83748.1 hypothetical protein BCR32DRAFT_307857 [Anaeromyces robustus]